LIVTVAEDIVAPCGMVTFWNLIPIQSPEPLSGMLVPVNVIEVPSCSAAGADAPTAPVKVVIPR
jgi:hypothetical protein